MGRTSADGDRQRAVHCADVSALSSAVDFNSFLFGLGDAVHPHYGAVGAVAGVNSELVITAFQSASGLVNLVTPTSAVVMGALVFGRIPYDRWLRYIWKLLAIFFVMTLVFLVVGAILA